MPVFFAGNMILGAVIICPVSIFLPKRVACLSAFLAFAVLGAFATSGVVNLTFVNGPHSLLAFIAIA
jgi:hypothetical protein